MGSAGIKRVGVIHNELYVIPPFSVLQSKAARDVPSQPASQPAHTRRLREHVHTDTHLQKSVVAAVAAAVAIEKHRRARQSSF